MYNRFMSSEELKKVMTDIYEDNYWGSDESKSGEGSTLRQTVYLQFELPLLFKRLGINSLLDIPCGDFNWMQRVLDRHQEPINYHGADLVQELVDANIAAYSKDNVSFSCLDAAADSLPRADLVFIRDLLVHLPDEMIFKVFKNVKDSGSKYVAMTHFAWYHMPNDSIQKIFRGNWRRLNMCMEPYNLPAPIDLIFEGSTEDLGKDKCIGVWRVEDLTEG